MRAWAATVPDLDTPDVAPSWQMPGGQRLRRHSWLPVTALPRNGLLEMPPYVYRRSAAGRAL